MTMYQEFRVLIQVKVRVVLVARPVAVAYDYIDQWQWLSVMNFEVPDTHEFSDYFWFMIIHLIILFRSDSGKEVA